MRINLAEFGGINGGKALNTQVIAEAISAIHSAGGGELYIPAGIYKSGTIRPVDNMSIVLEAGAVLLASENPEDYLHNLKETWQDCAFIDCRNLNNCTIRGEGTIDGNGMSFWRDAQGNIPTERTDPDSAVLLDQRDILRGSQNRPALVYFFHCSHVKVEGITLRESACYTLWFLACQDVQVTSINIRNYHCGPNTDGIDVDCSKRVLITGCNIETGDDAIALKTDCHRACLSENEGNEDVEVSNCILWSRCCGIRVGYEGDGPMRNCLFSDLVIRRAKIGINLLSVTPNNRMIPIRRGTPIERFRFQHIVIEESGQALVLWAGSERKTEEYEGWIRDVEFNDLTAKSEETCFIGSQFMGRISDIRLAHVRIEVGNENLLPDESVPRDDGMPSIWGGSTHRGGLRILRCEKIVMDHVSIVSRQKDHPVLVLEEMEDPCMTECNFRQE